MGGWDWGHRVAGCKGSVLCGHGHLSTGIINCLCTPPALCLWCHTILHFPINLLAWSLSMSLNIPEKLDYNDCIINHHLNISLVQFSCSVMSDSLQPHGLQHTRLPCLSSAPGVYSNSCPLSRWSHPTISSSVIPFSSRPQSFPASGSFQMSQFFASGGQSIGVSTSISVLTMNIQDWLPWELTDWVFLQSNELSKVFSNTTVQKHQFFSAQLSL